MPQSDVLVIGAGPTGLILALWLTKLGVKLRIIDKTAEPGTTSRALAIHARTLELYRQLDLADLVVARGHKVQAVRLWVKGKPQARVSFAEIASDLTPYAFLQIFPQDEHERLLIATLEKLGVSVERCTELLGYRDEGSRVVARLRRPDGREETCEAAYIAGCDGAHSIVRETMGTGYPGGTYEHPVLCRGCPSLRPSGRRGTPCRSRGGRPPRGISAGRKRTCALDRHGARRTRQAC